MILIVGHPRCGTGFMSTVFNALGYDVGHESVKSQGTSNWVFSVEGETCFDWIPHPREHYTFDLIVHCLRDPWKAIPSIAFTEMCPTKIPPTNWGWSNVFASTSLRQRHCGFSDDLPLIDQAIISYLEWNSIIAKSGPDVTVRIEQLATDLEKNAHVFAEKGYPIPSGDDLVSQIPTKTNYNSRQHRTFSSEHWMAADPELRVRLESFCVLNGYSAISDRLGE